MAASPDPTESTLYVKNLLLFYGKLINPYIRRDKRNKFLPSEFKRALRHCLQRTGKRIRPTVVFLSCQSVGGQFRKALRGAAAVELLHCASLVYDDIIDNDDFRRGLPALHKKYGMDVAIVVAGILLTRALNIIENRPKLVGIISSAMFDLGIGEAMDIRAKIEDIHSYLYMVGRKTATLFVTAADMGSFIGGASDQQRQGLLAYGYELGLAFQVRDDILGIVGDEDRLGKPVGSDLCNGRASVLTLLLAKNLGVSRTQLQQIAIQSDISDLVNSPESKKAVRSAKMMCQSHVQRAKRALRVLPESVHKRQLCLLVELAANRIH